ncbi:tetratricopeptide repeat protein [Chitinophaga sp. Hz27]|uniref:tetratricopeptide repeat protein n=1 Tax=Chitinophaga sp. Hz27 TaxID=3347169 RepID=UPI0035D73A9A
MAKGKALLQKAFVEMQKEHPDLEIAFNFLKQSANKGNAEALYAIGTWYLHGTFVEKNPFLAVEYFLSSIEGNYSSAYFDLAICYENGEGVKKNYRKAFECYLNAALLGDNQALYEVGRCYYYGIGISKNEGVANIWLKQAKEKGITD